MKKISIISFVIAIVVIACSCPGCESKKQPMQSASGVKQATVEVTTGSDGLTVEQRNISNKLTEENRVGAIRHLYVISAYSGDVLIYSTIKGKVTSSGKRLTPLTVVGAGSDMADQDGIPVKIGNAQYHTNEVLQDDGTHGGSIPYLYWYDTKDIFHKHYVSGGQIIHISTQPISVSKVILNLDGV